VAVLHTAVVLSVTAVFDAAVSGGFTYRGSPDCKRGIVDTAISGGFW
jgi:hypothetical protein